MSEHIPLIPRKVLFCNPDRALPKLSHDGKRISWLAAVDSVLNVWIGPADDLDKAKAVTHDTKRGIRMYFWAYTNDHIIYLQDKSGDENWRVYSVNLNSGKERDLTPFEGVNTKIQEVSYKFPCEILVALNNRTPQFHDIYRINIVTGKISLVQENLGMVSFVTDDNYKVRFASRMNIDGSMSILQPDGDQGWKEFMNIPIEDTLTTNLIGFDKSGQTMYFTHSKGRNTAAVVLRHLNTGEQKVIAEDKRVDAGNVLIHPTEKTIEAVAFNYDHNHWQVVNQSVAGDVEALSKLQNGEIQVISRTLDDKQWLVTFVTDTSPASYYHWDRATKKARFLFTDRQALKDYRLALMKPVIIRSRDGLDLMCYLTLPVDSVPLGAVLPDEPLPMVLLVHGGPWERDVWGYSPIHQMLANRGYAVLSVNFRGSTGFGKSFLNAANKEWGKKMHDDLIDAVDWAIQRRIADADRVAIMGGSYGGYATLVGMTMTPDKFACGVEIAGPSNLITFLNTIPPYWVPMEQVLKDRVGDHTTKEGREALHHVSPLTYVHNIKKPLLIGQGANDPRVKKSESDQIVRAMQEKKIPVTYVVFPDEGHGIARPENVLAYLAVTDVFLARHLGGRSEPVTTEDLNSSNIEIHSSANYYGQLPLS